MASIVQAGILPLLPLDYRRSIARIKGVWGSYPNFLAHQMILFLRSHVALPKGEPGIRETTRTSSGLDPVESNPCLNPRLQDSRFSTWSSPPPVSGTPSLWEGANFGACNFWIVSSLHHALDWWTLWDSNPRSSRCRRDAFPTKLKARLLRTRFST